MFFLSIQCEQTAQYSSRAIRIKEERRSGIRSAVKQMDKYLCFF